MALKPSTPLTFAHAQAIACMAVQAMAIAIEQHDALGVWSDREALRPQTSSYLPNAQMGYGPAHQPIAAACSAHSLPPIPEAVTSGSTAAARQHGNSLSRMLPHTEVHPSAFASFFCPTLDYGHNLSWHERGAAGRDGVQVGLRLGVLHDTPRSRPRPSRMPSIECDHEKSWRRPCDMLRSPVGVKKSV